jgi:hypothetical protein
MYGSGSDKGSALFNNSSIYEKLVIIYTSRISYITFSATLLASNRKLKKRMVQRVQKLHFYKGSQLKKIKE